MTGIMMKIKKLRRKLSLYFPQCQTRTTYCQTTAQFLSEGSGREVPQDVLVCHCAAGGVTMHISLLRFLHLCTPGSVRFHNFHRKSWINTPP